MIQCDWEIFDEFHINDMFFRSLMRQFSFMFSANDQYTIFILHIEWSQRWCQFTIEMCRCEIRQ